MEGQKSEKEKDKITDFTCTHRESPFLERQSLLFCHDPATIIKLLTLPR
jgi:hypothetical protein